jgi:hypothetical protein
MQQMILDATGQSFPDFMRRTVLTPLGMQSSSYQQPLPAEKAARTASGYYGDRTAVRGRWHVYPEMAAAGLWTTPSDLARFAIEVERAFAGTSRRVITRSMARQMLTDHREGDGLGVFLRGAGPTLQFSHNGRDEGFDALLVAYAATGQGVAIMINANDDSRMMGRILAFLARKYHWPDTPAESRPAGRASVSPALMESYAGRYEFHNNFMLTLVSEDTLLASVVGGFPDEGYAPEDSTRFASLDTGARFTVRTDSSGTIVGLWWSENGQERLVPRIGPLIRDLEPTADPDTAVTTRVTRAFRALAQGGEALANSPDLTAGARRDFSSGVGNALAGLGSVTFLGIQDVAARQIERHDSPVARIGYYRLVTGPGERFALVHLTENGEVTDFDLVDR